MIIELYKNSDYHYNKLLPLIAEWMESVGATGSQLDLRREYNYCSDHGLLIVVEDDERGPIAFGVGIISNNFWEGGKNLSERFLYVSKEYRGNSIGKMIVKGFEDIAKSRKCKRVFFYSNFDASKDPVKARDFYEKEGYHLYGYQMMKEI